MTSKIDFVFSQSLASPKGILVLPVAEDNVLMTSGSKLDKELKGALSRAMKTQEAFTGEKNEILVVNGFAHKSLTQVVLFGVGETKGLTENDFQVFGGTVAAHLNKSLVKEAMVWVDGFKTTFDPAAAMAMGASLRNYRLDKYKTKLASNQKNTLRKLAFLVADKKRADAQWKAIEGLTNGILLARDLVTEPPNKIYAETFVQRVRKEIKGLPLTLKLLNKKQMEKLGMGVLLAVNQASDREPYTLILEYNGLKNKKDMPVALVGKGVTFDTGGLCLKPGLPPGGWPMYEMKFDMAGGAAVVGAMMALAARKAKTNVVGLVGLVENVISDEAFMPADVVTSMSGQTIEVLNTDAEGRMVLADVMWYAQKTYKPKTIIDIATLTGAIVMALGDQYAGVFGNDDALIGKLTEAGRKSGDRAWHMPIDSALEKHVDSAVADVSNLGSGGPGSASAARFLERFVQKGVKWAHIDMAGTAWTKTGNALTPVGATGYGVRLFEQFVRDNFESK